jgi:23S rRNA (guanosine2251-2'-O)-methyltransferase
MPKRFHSRPNNPRPHASPAGLYIYGRHAVVAALANPARRVSRLLAQPETVSEMKALAAKAGARIAADVEVVSRGAFDALLPREAVHQGMALAADPLPEPNLAEIVAALPPSDERQIVMLLDRVIDPHNVGAILRSAAAFGAVAVVVPEHGAPPISGVLAKAASGALETVPLVRVANLAQALETLKDVGFWCLGLDGEAKHDLATLDLAQRVALVLGAEGEGMRRLTRERCDLLARLPTRRRWHSLNVSNAAAIALYEVATRKH